MIQGSQDSDFAIDVVSACWIEEAFFIDFYGNIEGVVSAIRLVDLAVLALSKKRDKLVVSELEAGRGVFKLKGLAHRLVFGECEV